MRNVKIGHNASAYLRAPLQRLNGIIHVKCFAQDSVYGRVQQVTAAEGKQFRVS